MRKKALEIALQQISEHSDPKPDLEQYSTPANIASDVLYFAHSQGDIVNKKVADLGCGTGIFAIGAKLLGAKDVIAVDIDDRAIEIAKENARKSKVEVNFQVCEIKDFNDKCDTVLQNPPFGAQKRHADRPFIDTALTISKVTYSLHASNTQKFIEKEAERLRAMITHKKEYQFEIKHTFKFHCQNKKNFEVVMFRMVKKGEENG
ncbi:MAG: 50S ribosomal protein L11 methyltransferase [Thermoplasmata archaeon]|nr:MAG: 50S ribosomal protein L11 methyltransferase [Thermoplasmata archaeon]